MFLSELSWPQVKALPRSTPIVFPVAAVEQHGEHLPVFVDSMLLGEVVRRAAERLAGRVVFAPLLWLGNSDHHLDFPGTLSSPPRAYLDLLAGEAECFLRHGFTRLVFLNGHGGNDVPGRQAIFELRQRHRERNDLLFLFATYWTLAPPPRPSGAAFVQHNMGHACEWETSMMLRLAPHLVGNYRGAAPVEPGTLFEPATRAWTTRDRSAPGHIGHPALATAEKGEALFRAFSDGAVRLLEEVVGWDGTWSGARPADAT